MQRDGSDLERREAITRMTTEGYLAWLQLYQPIEEGDTAALEKLQTDATRAEVQ